MAIYAISVSALTTITASTMGAQTTAGVSYALVNHELTTNEPAFVRFSFQNETIEAVTLDVAFNDVGYGGFRGKLIRPDGRVVEGGKPSAAEAASIDRPRVEPGNSYSKLLLLNRWGDFDLPGRYILDIEATRPIITDNGTKLGIPTDGHLIIDVGPRDPHRLERICDDLLRKVIDSWPRVTDMETAAALSYIKDPVAVPYLSKLAEVGNGSFHPVAISGLARIADETAVDALIPLANATKDPIDRQVAQSLLGKIMSTTTNPLIRQKILNSRH
jgi:hypothetical protein